MKAALIPPTGLEAYALHSNFHLAIATQQCMANEEYMLTYSKARLRGDYIILDNGAADGGLVTNTQLITAALQIKANEIVAPDVFYEGKKTIKKVLDFLNWLAITPLCSTLPSTTKIMAVVQGNSPIRLYECVEAFAQEPAIAVLGLPKHLLTTLVSKTARIDLAQWIETHYPGRFELHLLGTNPVSLKEIHFAAKYTTVRSVDTALPFNYALADQDLVSTKQELTRNPEYFDVDWSETVSARLVDRNIRTYLEWAGATYIPSTPVGKL